jgi:hypothetical protein
MRLLVLLLLLLLQWLEVAAGTALVPLVLPAAADRELLAQLELVALDRVLLSLH